MKTPPIYAFTDCKDSNALIRLEARLNTLFPDSAIYGVGINSDIEASGCILDTLDAIRIGKTAAIIIGNLAPRGDKHHKNGAPFYVGYAGTTIIIANYTCFSMLNKFKLVTSITETDVETVCKKFLPKKEAERIANSQFRSFEYVPRLACFAYDKKKIPGTPSPLPTYADEQIWWIDNFGNCKTTLTGNEIKEGVLKNTIVLNINSKKIKLPVHERLADVPKGSLAMIIGSSGYGDDRFAEIVLQGGNASSKLKITPGSKISL
jgi:hypothetical protein